MQSPTHAIFAHDHLRKVFFPRHKCSFVTQRTMYNAVAFEPYNVLPVTLNSGVPFSTFLDVQELRNWDLKAARRTYMAKEAL